MNFHAFMLHADRYLTANGWTRAGHNGTWPVLRPSSERWAAELQARTLTHFTPLPVALLHELERCHTLHPTVEAYLTGHGWLRVKAQVTLGYPVFERKGPRDGYKNLPRAMVEQLKIHRLDRNTPTQVLREVHSVGVPHQ